MLHTPTSQPLFSRHKSAAELLEKQAAAVARMPDDDKRWPAQVLSEMHKQLPFLSRFDVDIEMTRIEPEAGYAIGYAMLRNKTGKQRAAEELGKPTNKIRVPVIVADRLLQPFHVFEVGGKTYPLTQERLESAMMNPSMFDGISDPPGTQSLLDQIYPPFQHRQGYGMMSGDRATTGVSKISSAPRATKTASGNLGPLREFLQQQEVEKVAFNAQTVQGAKRVGQFFSGIAGGFRGASQRVGANLLTPRGTIGAAREGFALRGTIGAARDGFALGASNAVPGKITQALESMAARRAGAGTAGGTGAGTAPAVTAPASRTRTPRTRKADPLQATAQDPHAWNAYIAENKLPAGTSLEQLRGHQASYNQFKAAQPGTEMTFDQFLKHTPPAAGPAANPGLFQRAPSTTAGGATMLGLGTIGGGMVMANKASENY